MNPFYIDLGEKQKLQWKHKPWLILAFPIMLIMTSLSWMTQSGSTKMINEAAMKWVIGPLKVKNNHKRNVNEPGNSDL